MAKGGVLFMRGGISTSVGIVFYDTKKEGENAVFCFYDGEEPSFKKGEKEALIKEMDSADEKNKTGTEKSEIKMLGITFLSLLGLIAAVWVFSGGFFAVFGTVLFAVLSYYPMMIIIFAANRIYPDEEAFHQFRRFHGAEHMMLEYHHGENLSWEIEDIRKTSFYHRECGTVYAASGTVFSAIAGISFALIPKIGFLWFLGITVFSFAGLFINLVNRHNPLMIFQRFAVEKPGEREILLAAKGMKILEGIE